MTRKKLSPHLVAIRKSIESMKAEAARLQGKVDGLRTAIDILEEEFPQPPPEPPEQEGE